jgi:transposase
MQRIDIGLNFQTASQLFHHTPDLQTLYDQHQELTDIFDHPTLTVKEARQEITAWTQRVTRTGVRGWTKFFGTLTTHWEEITDYFANRHNSGFVEGLNNKIKVIKRRCYGILNPQHLFQRIALDLAGYQGEIRK